MKKTLIKSDVAGVVNEICFSKGDMVKKGESLLFIESMKMEIPIEAPFDSEIEEIFTKKDEVISQNQPLLILIREFSVPVLGWNPHHLQC